MSTKAVQNVNSVLMPLVFMVAVGLAVFSGMRFFDKYTVKLVPKPQTSVEQIKFSQTPVVQIGKARYGVIAISYHSKPSERQVFIKNMQTNQMQSARPNQTVFNRLKVTSIEKTQLKLNSGSQSIIVHLPSKKRLF